MATASFNPEAVFAALSFEDKCHLVAGADVWRTVAQPAAKLPYIKLSDGPVGARGGGGFVDSVPAALFPSSSALGATFDVKRAQEMGSWIAKDARSKQVHLVLGPTINIVRDPRNGRTFETYSEDALLCGVIGGGWARGCQREGCGATLKHFVANEVEYDRRFSSSNVDERTLREIYLKPFQIALRDVKHAAGTVGEEKAVPFEGGVAALMTAYNRVNGISASEHERLWHDVVRKEWGYDGLVVSDWFALHAHGLKTTDLEMPGPSIFRQPNQVKELLAKGEITQNDLDARVKRILQLIKRVEPLGLLTSINQEHESSIQSEELSKAIRTIAAEAAVLLKNEGEILPLASEGQKLHSIALIGAPATDAKSFQSGGGSANMTSQYLSSPSDALQQALPQTKFTYADGVDMWEFPPAPPLQGKVQLDFYNGKQTGKVHKFASVESDLLEWGTNLVQLPAGAEAGNWFVRLQTTIQPQKPGKHRLAIVGLGTVSVNLQGHDTWTETFHKDLASVAIYPAKGWTSKSFDWTTEPVQVQVEYRPPTHYSDEEGANIWAREHHFASFLAGWIEDQDEQLPLDNAAKVASQAELAIVFVGTGNKFEGEENDRKTLTLPKNQDALVQAVIKKQPRTVVVNLSGAPVEMPWLDSVPAVVQAWFGGQESGNAIADVLLGRGEAPASGRLPSTWPVRTTDLPTGSDERLFPGIKESQDPVGPNVYYDEGVLIGAAHFEAHNKQPLAWFGQGLGGYTTFNQSLLWVRGTLQGPDSCAKVRVRVQNTGTRPGKAVVQLYILDVQQDRKRKLAAFDTVRLDAGEGAEVVLVLDQEAVSHWEGKEDGHWTVNQGDYTIVLANSANPQDEISRTTLSVNNSWVWNGLGRI